MLLAREALFLHGGDDFTVANQARGRVMIIGGYAQNVHADV